MTRTLCPDCIPTRTIYYPRPCHLCSGYAKKETP